MSTSIILSVSLWLIIAPLFIVQYALAIFCLTRLAYCKISVRAYVLWNLFILLIFFVGSAVFLTYYFINRKKLRAEDEPVPSAADAILVDDADSAETGVVTPEEKSAETAAEEKQDEQ